ncbi:hypothetical protein BZG36_00392 [Bifiguratus adelaidae]|uniref:Uncharacterized protein n=1 Tax=Bifiguratus adelaidae TaxID=1938954 RepID=A0A261Y7S9_9FUNG|nr:hypothetical protein BZG36_00392 [Bifiguratus adelaidae]
MSNPDDNTRVQDAGYFSDHSTTRSIQNAAIASGMQEGNAEQESAANPPLSALPTHMVAEAPQLSPHSTVKGVTYAAEPTYHSDVVRDLTVGEVEDGQDQSSKLAQKKVNVLPPWLKRSSSSFVGRMTRSSTSNSIETSNPKWHTFTIPAAKRKQVSDESTELEQQQPASFATQLPEHDWSKPWLPTPTPNDTNPLAPPVAPKWRIKDRIIHSTWLPLCVKATIMLFCIISLGLAGSICHINQVSGLGQVPSTIFVIVMAPLVMGYTLWTIYDEYAGSPMGLRATNTKLAIMLIDLFFVILWSANLAAAFSVYLSNWNCQDPGQFTSNVNDGSLTGGSDISRFLIGMCRLQAGLVSLMFCGLIAWVFWFFISFLKMFHRIDQAGRPREFV